MAVRSMEQEDVDRVSALCLAAFAQSVAPTTSAEGVATFADVASAAAFRTRMDGDNLMLVFEQAGVIHGVIELKAGRHLAMLFVHPDAQRRGIGRQLLAAAVPHVRVAALSVSASLSSVPAYLHYGFQCSGEPAVSGGLDYQPMLLQL